MFDEAFGSRCGRQAVVDRLFEVVLIRIFRQLMASAQVDSGLLAGLAHPQLARWRIGLAQQSLRAGLPLKLIAADVGYGSATALSRAFAELCGRSPRAWLRER